MKKDGGKTIVEQGKDVVTIARKMIRGDAGTNDCTGDGRDDG